MIVILILIIYSGMISYEYFSPGINVDKLNKIHEHKIDSLNNELLISKININTIQANIDITDKSIDKEDSNINFINPKFDEIRNHVVHLYADSAILILSKNLSGKNNY